jgi:membrane-bound serine protease (ClpP class)
MTFFSLRKHDSVLSKRFILLLGISMLLLWLLPAPGMSEKDSNEGRAAIDRNPRVLVITVNGPINPVTAGYIDKGIAEAAEREADLLVLRLDTPGGLMSSMRTIVKSIMASPVPVAVYVSPSGARAASAGVFITMAAHVAAMAPGTNIGAAHPVNIGGGSPFGKKKEEEDEKDKEGKDGDKEKEGEKEDSDQDKESQDETLSDESVMARKVINDTVAFVKSIAEKNGRNAEWAERSVRESISSTEREALAENVIDLVAENLDKLLEEIDGRTVRIDGEEVTLTVAGADIDEMPMDLRERILAAVSDPNIAYLLMMLGVYGLFFELANPGVILPGVLGGIFLILAFFSFQVIPVNYAGVLLIGVGLILFILEIKVVSYGMLSVGGIVSTLLGSIMLIDSIEPYYRISRTLIFGVTGFTALFFLVGLGLAFKVQRRKVVTGIEGMIGITGETTTEVDPEGKVKVHGEIWSAVSDTPIPAGKRIKVINMDGMVVRVEPEPRSESDGSEEH